MKPYCKHEIALMHKCVMCKTMFKQKHPNWDNAENYRYMKDGTETIVVDQKTIDRYHKRLNVSNPQTFVRS